MSLRIKDFKEYDADMRSRVRQYSAYVEQEEQSQSAMQMENKLILKVPVEQFETLLL